MTQNLLDFSVLEEAKEEEPKSNAWGRLIPLSTNKNSFNIELINDVVVFGRASSCDVVFNDPGVSGKHCTFRRELIGGQKSNEAVIWIEDHSTNGTTLNGELIGKGSKKLALNGSTVHFLFKGKGRDVNISYVFHDCRKDEAEQHETGGPHAQYILHHTLGTGNFAQVRLAIHRESLEKYAIKIIDKKKFSLSNSTKRPNALMDEVKILSKLKHPNIIGIKEVFETETNLYIVLELVTGGELFDKLTNGAFSEDLSRSYFKQMLEATKYLHDQGIAHRDLKPENILFKDETEEIIKLSDFGLSRVVDKASFMQTICGTPQYVAPEILTSAKTEGYGLACDLWSLGVILYIMLSGSQPFDDEKSTTIFEQIVNTDYSFAAKKWKSISPNAIRLIKQLLNPNPSKRLTVSEALESPWMQGIAGDPLSDDSKSSDSVAESESEEPSSKKRPLDPEQQTPSKKCKK